MTLTMNLYNFEEMVDPVIVSRGVHYYEEGWVSRVSCAEDGNFHAVVSGMEDYHVLVVIDKDFNIMTSTCNCPFEGGPVCKHQTAVYYEMIDLVKDPEELHIHETTDLRTVLDSLSKEQLLETILKLANEDTALYDRLLFSYGNEDTQQEPIYYKKLFQMMTKQYRGREGFISYHDAEDFADELHDVLNDIEVLDNPVKTMEIACVFFKEVMHCLDFMDDSGGGMSFLLMETFSKMLEIMDSSNDYSIQRNMLEQLLQLIDSPELDEWSEYRLDILKAALPAAHHTQLANILQTKLEELLGDNTRKYYEEEIYRILLEIITIHGSADDITKFLETHLHYSSFRRLLIEQKMEKSLFDDVIQLTIDGEKQDANYAGLILQWKQWRYEAYKQAGNENDQIKLGHELISKGIFEYYIDLKKLSGPNFNYFYESLKKQLALENSNSYSKLITTENDIEAIAAYVEKRPHEIESYLEYLMETHSELAIRLFASNIQLDAAKSNNRKQYQEVCRTIRRFAIIAGIDAGKSIAAELKSTYKRRPAFVDELDKFLHS